MHYAWLQLMQKKKSLVLLLFSQIDVFFRTTLPFPPIISLMEKLTKLKETSNKNGCFKKNSEKFTLFFASSRGYLFILKNIQKKQRLKHRSLEYIDWARAEFTCSDLSCLDERLGDFEKFPLPWLGEAHSTSHLGNQANRARSPRLSS